MITYCRSWGASASTATADVMSVLLPHWATKHETMRRIKQRLSRIFRWAVAEGYRTDDPAGATLDAALPRNGQSTRHFAALPHGEVAAAIATVRNSGAWPGTKAAFEFLVLTACRSGYPSGGNSTWSLVSGLGAATLAR